MYEGAERRPGGEIKREKEKKERRREKREGGETCKERTSDEGGNRGWYSSSLFERARERETK